MTPNAGHPSLLPLRRLLYPPGEMRARMVRAKKPLPAKLFVSLRMETPEIFTELLEALVANYGESDLRSPTHESLVLPGGSERPVQVKLLSFETLIDPGRLARIKPTTDRVERELKPRGKRGARPPVTIQPGYVTSAKIVTASRRNAAHRIYLGRGVYGEITMAHLQGAFHPHPWTQPHYRAAEVVEFFRTARERYLEQIQLA